MAEISLLKKVALFESMSESEMNMFLPLIRPSARITGDCIFNENEEAVSLFIVKSGAVEIYKHGPDGDDARIATFLAGSHFGEMALLDHAPRTASAFAGENSELLEIRYNDLDGLLKENQDIAIKLYRSFAQFLCRRVRQTTLEYATLKELKLRHS